MAIEWVVGIAIVCLLVGFGLARILPIGDNKKIRVAELEAALAAAQSEFTDYKGEVFGQFAETAQKFRALDKSYIDLHRHLAESSVALCGDAVTPLLANVESDTATAEISEDVLVNSDGEFGEDKGQSVERVDVDATDKELDRDLIVGEAVEDDGEAKASTVSETLESEVPTLTEVDESEVTLEHKEQLEDDQAAQRNRTRSGA